MPAPTTPTPPTPTLQLMPIVVHDGRTGEAYSLSIAARGGKAPRVYAVTGLPAGLSVDQTTGVISGTPGSSGTARIKIKVTAGAGTEARTIAAEHDLHVHDPVTLTLSAAETTEGDAYTAQITAGGGKAPLTYAISGLPAGLTSDAKGKISGKATAVGTVTVSVTVTDASKDGDGKPGKAQGSYQLKVLKAAIEVLPGALIAATAGKPYAMIQYSARDRSETYTFAVSGALPTGMTFTTDGKLQGTPTQVGAFPITVKATESGGSDPHIGERPMSITVSPPVLNIKAKVATPHNTVDVGGVPSDEYEAEGGSGQFAYSAAGLPDGVTIDPSGKLVGSATKPGSYGFVITAEDKNITDTASPGAKFTIAMSGTLTVKRKTAFSSVAKVGDVAASCPLTLLTNHGIGPADVLTTAGTLLSDRRTERKKPRPGKSVHTPTPTVFCNLQKLQLDLEWNVPEHLKSKMQRPRRDFLRQRGLVDTYSVTPENDVNNVNTKLRMVATEPNITAEDYTGLTGTKKEQRDKLTPYQRHLLDHYAIVVDLVLPFSADGLQNENATTTFGTDNLLDIGLDLRGKAVFTYSDRCGVRHVATRWRRNGVDPLLSHAATDREESQDITLYMRRQPDLSEILRRGWRFWEAFDPRGLGEYGEAFGVSCGAPRSGGAQLPLLAAYVRVRPALDLVISVGFAGFRWSWARKDAQHWSRNGKGEAATLVEHRAETERMTLGKSKKEAWHHISGKDHRNKTNDKGEVIGREEYTVNDDANASNEQREGFHTYPEEESKQESDDTNQRDAQFYDVAADDDFGKATDADGNRTETHKGTANILAAKDAKEKVGKVDTALDLALMNGLLRLGVTLNGTVLDTRHFTDMIKTIQDVIDVVQQILFFFGEGVGGFGVPISPVTLECSTGFEAVVGEVAFEVRRWMEIDERLLFTDMGAAPPPLTGTLPPGYVQPATREGTYYLTATKALWQARFNVTVFKGTFSLFVGLRFQIIHKRLLSIIVGIEFELSGGVALQLPFWTSQNGIKPSIKVRPRLEISLGAKGEANCLGFFANVKGDVGGAVRIDLHWGWDVSDNKYTWRERKVVLEPCGVQLRVNCGHKLAAAMRCDSFNRSYVLPRDGSRIGYNEGKEKQLWPRTP